MCHFKAVGVWEGEITEVGRHPHCCTVEPVSRDDTGFVAARWRAASRCHRGFSMSGSACCVRDVGLEPRSSLFLSHSCSQRDSG